MRDPTGRTRPVLTTSLQYASDGPPPEPCASFATVRTPAQHLALAVLETGVSDLLHTAGIQTVAAMARFTEVHGWITSTRRDYLFAFANVCDLVGLDPDALRRRLLERVAPFVTGQTAGPAPTRWRRRRPRVDRRVVPAGAPDTVARRIVRHLTATGLPLPARALADQLGLDRHRVYQEVWWLCRKQTLVRHHARVGLATWEVARWMATQQPVVPAAPAAE